MDPRLGLWQRRNGQWVSAMDPRYGWWDDVSASAVVDTGGGGGGAYVAKAVHFDGTAWLHTASLSSLAATTNYSYAMWLKVAAANDTQPAAILESGPENNGINGISQSSPQKFFLFNDATDGSGVLNTAPDDNSSPNDVWHCIIVSCDSQSGVVKCYDGDTDITGSVTPSGVPFNMTFDGISLWVGFDGYPGDEYIGDMCNVIAWPGVSLLTAGDIPVTKRRLFITAGGKPVDPAFAVAALGAPAVLLSGDATDFTINQGAGGAFTLTGTLTDATTSPSD